ncbi:MAG: cyclic nucleotide-binding domain-containing protein [Cyanobacteriota bacterium]
MLTLQILGLIGLLLITLPLGRAKERGRVSWMQWIPSLRFVRLLLLDLLVNQIFAIVGQPPRYVQVWILHFRDLSYFLAIYDVVVDYLWLLYVRFTGPVHAPPKILQDTIFVAGLSLIVGGYLYTEGVINGLGAAAFASMVAFVIGPGMTAQLQNLSSGLSIQAERQFGVGDWIEFNGHVGRVISISWNNTVLYDDEYDRHVLVPNSQVDQALVVNLSRPSSAFRLSVDVGLPYEMAPELARELLLEALEHQPCVLRHEPKDVVLLAFSASSIDYRLYFSTDDYHHRFQVCTEVRSRIWYAVQRRGYSIPFPILDLRPISHSLRQGDLQASRQKEDCFAALRALELLSPLRDDELLHLASSQQVLAYGIGEHIIHQHERDRSMYVLMDGECDVVVGEGADPSTHRVVATLSSGSLFGEMSALADSPRSASIVARTPATVLRIAQNAIQEIIVANHEAMEGIVALMAKREANLKAFSEQQTRKLEESLMAQIATSLRRFLGAQH